MRVAVPFGQQKIYTGLVYSIHQIAPTAYEVKNIHQILDELPIVTEHQITLWEWMAQYYMCTLGEVMRAALPSAFLLQSETKIFLNKHFSNFELLSDDEYTIIEVLQNYEVLDIDKVSFILSKKNVLPVIKSLLEKNAIHLQEILYEKYIPKLTKYIRLHENWQSEESWQLLFDTLKGEKQKAFLLHYFQEKAETQKPIALHPFLKKFGISGAVAKNLHDKSIIDIYTLQEDRIKSGNSDKNLPQLNDYQENILKSIQIKFTEKDITLLHGVTGSGKTEIYVHLIQEILKNEGQVLYLVPEIALTTQLLERLKLFFGAQITVFHSKYNLNERVEVWNNILNHHSKARLIVGARSAVLLPFQHLKLIIVDEEHETSYKQYELAPRYHARDTAIVLAKQMNAKVLLGTATPSVESYFNTQNQKYGLLTLNQRYGNAVLPDIELVDLKQAQKKKEINGHFSQTLIAAIQEALDQHEQVILFQNRRGFAPVVTCTSCGISLMCPHCDVSLTYHKHKNELHCHYCSYHTPMAEVCPACHNASLSTVGFGTEQLEDELKGLFPNHITARMDYDTTRGKNAYYNIIAGFQAQEIDILVGTQMLSKGLDFSNVSVVGVINADTLLNFPDFRAHERSFQMLVQVSGRAGRSDKKGKVIIQTFNPNHPILKLVQNADFTQMYENQIIERHLYHYPPYYRLIKISLKHKNFHTLQTAAEWMGLSLRNFFKENVLGPTPPAVSRVNNYYLYDILLKIPPEQSVHQTKINVLKIRNLFQNIKEFRSVRISIDVDVY